MPVVVTNGTPIRTTFPLTGSLANALPEPQIKIDRSPQQQDAWCYAACAEMVVTHLQPLALTSQCEIAGIAKDTPCCSPTPAICTRSGCTIEQVGQLLKGFDITYEGANPGVELDDAVSRILLDEVESEIAAGRPIQVVIDWLVGEGQSSHAVLIVGVHGNDIYVIDPIRGINYNGWQPYDSVKFGFGQGRWARTWLNIRNV